MEAGVIDALGEGVTGGSVGGGVSEWALWALRFDGRYLVIGVEWGGWVPRHQEENKAMIGEIVAAVACDELRPMAPFERCLDEAGNVLGELLDRCAVGKIVLVP